MPRPRSYDKLIVTATPDMVGAVFPGHELLSAVACALKARDDGWEGKLYARSQTGALHEFDIDGRSFGNPLADTPFPKV